jgi:hypothetical protein
MLEKPKSHALEALDRSISEHENVLKRARKKEARERRPPGKQRDGSELCEALPGTLAHASTRRSAAEHLIDTLLERHAKTEGSNRRTFLATFAWDEGILRTDQAQLSSVAPQLHKVYKALNEFGLAGVMLIDFALFDPEDEPPYIHIHIHVICWTYDQAFKPGSIRKELRKRRAFKNSRFKSVDIRSRKEAANLFQFKDSPHYAHVFAKLHRDQTKASIAWLGQYVWAAPNTTKRVVKHPATGKGRIVNLANSDNAEGLHIQADNLMKQLSIYDCIAAIGEGCGIRREWKKAMAMTLRQLQYGSLGGPASSLKRRRKKTAKRRRSLPLLARALQSVC